MPGEDFDSALQAAVESKPKKIGALFTELGENITDLIERDLQESGEKEVPSAVIGEKAMARLREADEVAYVRFASVYRSFRDIDEFLAELGKLVKAREAH